MNVSEWKGQSEREGRKARRKESSLGTTLCPLDALKDVQNKRGYCRMNPRYTRGRTGNRGEGINNAFNNSIEEPSPQSGVSAWRKESDFREGPSSMAFG